MVVNSSKKLAVTSGFLSSPILPFEVQETKRKKRTESQVPKNSSSGWKAEKMCILFYFSSLDASVLEATPDAVAPVSFLISSIFRDMKLRPRMIKKRREKITKRTTQLWAHEYDENKRRIKKKQKNNIMINKTRKKETIEDFRVVERRAGRETLEA